MKALILVDIQNDFVHGSLKVDKAIEVIDVANNLTSKNKFDLVVATQDWHPANHKSFRSNNNVPDDEIVGELNGFPQIWWPDHCVQGSHGAEFEKSLDTNSVAAIFRKGMNPQIDSYSGFFDNKAIINGKEVTSSTGLSSYLRSMGVTDTYVMGLATDYCVMFTALDSVKCGFNTHLITDGCRAVNVNKTDEQDAINKMQAAGVELINSSSLV